MAVYYSLMSNSKCTAGLESVSINLAAQEVTVTTELSTETVLAQLKKCGKEVTSK